MSSLWRKSALLNLFIKIPRVKAASSSSVTYFQGQQCADTGRREYFYYVDHQGMVRLEHFEFIYNFVACPIG